MFTFYLISICIDIDIDLTILFMFMFCSTSQPFVSFLVVNVQLNVKETNHTLFAVANRLSLQIHLRAGQKLFVEVAESAKGYSVAPVSYRVDPGAEIAFPSTLVLLGKRCIFEGRTLGVRSLTVAEGSDVVFSSTTQTGIKENGSFVYLTSNGNITFGELIVQKNSRLEFSKINETLVLTTAVFKIKYHALVNMNHGEIDSGNAVVESEGRLVLEGTGHPGERGSGHGDTVNDVGTGGGHGGEGGATQVGQSGGRPYGSVYRPRHQGSGGGHGQGQGGTGGGMLHWRVGEDFELDGLVTLAGKNGSGLDAGGGSGGSILIETTNFTGYGEINVAGGGGTGRGSGAAGGRIAVHVRFKHKFAGLYRIYGGSGASYGAAGTAYVEETARGPQYADIKYDKKTYTTYTVATHRYVEIDNDNRKTKSYSMLLESDHSYYEFDEVYLTRQANLQVRHPPKSPNVTVVVHRLLGDKTGRFHLRHNQTIYVEVVESQTNVSTAPCSFKIDERAEIVFPSVVHIVGIRSIIEGRITGVHDFVVSDSGEIEFSSTSETARTENREYVEINGKGNFSFGTVTVERRSLLTFRRINNTLRLKCADLRIMYEGRIVMNHGEFYSAYAYIESEGLLTLEGKGFGPEEGPGRGSTSSGVASGAGYGGEGGKTVDGTRGSPYGSVFSPRLFGSGGGNGLGTGGWGGGYLLWKIGKRLELNGFVMARGTNGTGSNAGGGSGGSVLIVTTNMTGNGEIAVTGGNGTGGGGGGAGGRVGIHCRWRYAFTGKVTNHGGSGGPGGDGGAGGTLYREENFKPLGYRHLKYDKKTNESKFLVDHTYVRADNAGGKASGATFVMEENTTYYEFQEVELTGNCRLLAYHPSNKTVKVVVHKFYGDKSGQFHLRNGQKAYIEADETVPKKIESPCGYIVDAGAELVLPSELHIHGTATTIGGMITGLRHLRISAGSKVFFASTTQTALIENGTYIQVSEPGNISLASLTIKRSSEVEFRRVTEFLRLTVSKFTIKYEGKFFMNYGEIFSSYAKLDSKGSLNLDYHGHQAEHGPGAGQTVQVNGLPVGQGAGHGGQGGREGGDPYGSVYEPNKFGSGGGNGNGRGGVGGGKLFWEIAQSLKLNGILSARGADGTGSDAGGGSGGSILIKTTNMSGHGVITVVGGAGSGGGGGGAGGRVGIHCRWRYTYGGQFIDRGGLGNSLNNSAPAGTVYKEENYRPLEYRHLKYMKETNVTMLAVDHTYLHVDNEGNNVPGATMLMEEQTLYYEFDEIELTGYSRLLIYHPRGRNVTVITHKFIGDRTGQFHLRDNQTIYVEVVESETNRTEAPCSYLIDSGAEIVLPAEFHAHGLRTEIHGLITGVHFFLMEDSAYVVISSTARTALVENREYVEITRAGNCSFAHVVIKQGGRLNLVRADDVIVAVTSALFEVHFEGQVNINHGVLYSNYGEVETKGQILLDGAGHKAATGPGAGSSYSSYGSGGGHGGQGGKGGPQSAGYNGGQAYDSVYKPLEFGSGGGHAAGSTGGDGK